MIILIIVNNPLNRKAKINCICENNPLPDHLFFPELETEGWLKFNEPLTTEKSLSYPLTINFYDGEELMFDFDEQEIYRRTQNKTWEKANRYIYDSSEICMNEARGIITINLIRLMGDNMLFFRIEAVLEGMTYISSKQNFNRVKVFEI